MVDDLKLSSPKTKDFLAVLSALQLHGTALIVGQGDDANLRRASRNVAQVELTTGEDLNTYQVLRSDKLVFTRGALETVAQRLTQE